MNKTENWKRKKIVHVGHCHSSRQYNDDWSVVVKKKQKNVSTQAAARLFTRRHPQANITSRRRQQSSQYNVVPSQYASAISDREAKSKC